MRSIFITCGDPNGIGPEVTLKSLARLPQKIQSQVILAGSYSALTAINQLLGEPLALVRVQSLEDCQSAIGIPVLEPNGAQDFKPVYGQISAQAGSVAGRGLMLGVAACRDGQSTALVTAPSSKEALHLAGFYYPGQTEMIAALCGQPDIIMILAAGSKRVAMATTHHALRDVSGQISRDLVWKKIAILQQSLVTWFGIADPRLAVAALNPHASDGGMFGDEEASYIRPAVEDARQSGVRVEGPFPADTLFLRWKDFDAILAMYHDQGMIPIKMAGFGRAVHLTGGLPFPRTSPDHGTAFDIAGKLVADPGSMTKAIQAALRFARRGLRSS